jgi:hypothetical protein
MCYFLKCYPHGHWSEKEQQIMTGKENKELNLQMRFARENGTNTWKIGQLEQGEVELNSSGPLGKVWMPRPWTLEVRDEKGVV